MKLDILTTGGVVGVGFGVVVAGLSLGVLETSLSLGVTAVGVLLVLAGTVAWQFVKRG